ncbi:MAG: hypothetical protein ACREXR_19700, partial [Gammaproteobacteria bacterium]
ELRAFSLGVGEDVNEFTGSDFIGAVAAARVHVDVSVGMVAKDIVEEGFRYSLSGFLYDLF